VALPLDRREAREDILLGHILLAKKFVNPEQLRKAVAEQAAGLARGRKKPRRLGVILAEQGRITDQQYIGFLREIEERIQEEEAAREKDAQLAEVLLDENAISPEHLDECLRLQEEAYARGDEVIHRLGELLIEKKCVKPERLARALSLVELSRAGTPRLPAAPAPPLLRRRVPARPAAAPRPLPPKAVPAAPPPKPKAPATAPPKPPKVLKSSKPDLPLIDPPPEGRPDEKTA
jgi:hypothetical protein